jgi:hypothetical protein
LTVEHRKVESALARRNSIDVDIPFRVRSTQEVLAVLNFESHYLETTNDSERLYAFNLQMQEVMRVLGVPWIPGLAPLVPEVTQPIVEQVINDIELSVHGFV